MADEVVIDASVAAKCFFSEVGSDEARRFVAAGAVLIAPDLIFAEIASVASKKVRRGEITEQLGRDAVEALADLLDEIAPTRGLVRRAFDLAADHGFSAYDGVYLALAESRMIRVVTADLKLIDRTCVAGLAGLARPP